jgi:protein-S-isoprenylcysteine O-methyltransferase Ste14
MMIAAKLTIFMTPFIGGISLLLFLIFLFNGSFNFIDLGFTDFAGLTWDVLLSMVFFVQHSGMIRRRFRSRLSTLIPSHYIDAVYAITSAVTLTAVIILWQPSSTVLYELQGSLRWMCRSIFFIAIAGVGWGFRSLKAFDPFGRTPVKNYFEGKVHQHQSFTAGGAYLWVRHPLYFFSLLLIWSCPDLYADRFIFNLLWTVWIILGTVLEEKDLVSDLGDDYRQYQKKIPMLIPWKGRGRL